MEELEEPMGNFSKYLLRQGIETYEKREDKFSATKLLLGVGVLVTKTLAFQSIWGVWLVSIFETTKELSFIEAFMVLQVLAIFTSRDAPKTSKDSDTHILVFGTFKLILYTAIIFFMNFCF